jgi:hypothetical protein
LFKMKGTGLQFPHLPVRKWKFAPMPQPHGPQFSGCDAGFAGAKLQ